MQWVTHTTQLSLSHNIHIICTWIRFSYKSKQFCLLTRFYSLLPFWKVAKKHNKQQHTFLFSPLTYNIIMANSITFPLYFLHQRKKRAKLRKMFVVLLCFMLINFIYIVKYFTVSYKEETNTTSKHIALLLLVCTNMWILAVNITLLEVPSTSYTNSSNGISWPFDMDHYGTVKYAT